jgi:hypothetical protein
MAEGDENRAIESIIASDISIRRLSVAAVKSADK